MPRSEPVLIYDGDCRLCTRLVRGVKRIDFGDRMRTVPSGADGVLDAFGLTAAQAQARVWLRHPSGTKVGGAGAVMCALDVIFGGRFGSRLYSCRPIRKMLDRGYAWVAANRMRLGGGPADCGDACQIVPDA